MNAALLVTLIETTVPFGVTFNQWGVAQRGFRYEFSFRKLSVKLDVCAVNGLWGGSVRISTNTWGCAGPISKSYSFRFSSFEECVEHLWSESLSCIERNKSNVSIEFLHFKAAMYKWLTCSSEEKLNTFKEVDFYVS